MADRLGAFSRRSRPARRRPPISRSRSRARPIRRWTFRSIRAGAISWSSGVDRWAALAGTAEWPDGGAGARRIRSRHRRACCSTPAPARIGAIATARPAASIGRSEGLALASLAMFGDGLFSAEPPRSVAGRRGGAARSRRTRRSAAASRPSPAIRCSGVDGRADLLRRLGRAVAAAPSVFARADEPRPGGLVRSSGRRCATADGFAAPVILAELLRHLGPDLADAARRSAAFRSATAGAIRRSAATTRPTASCRCTSSRNGSPIR